MGGKHTKCCCPGCLIGDDDFNRVDNDDPGPLWNEISGDWDISSNTLVCVSAGMLITKLRQVAPVDSSNYSYRFQFRALNTATEWKVICKFIDTSNFDWIQIYDSGGGNYKPRFYRRVATVDTLIMDDTTHEMGGSWTIGAEGLLFFICYSDLEWAISAALGSFDWVTCDATPATALPTAPNGFIGFFADSGQGDIDDFSYSQHWESNHDCEDCTCFCWDGVDAKCIPETLTLTLTPTVDHTDCPGTPASHTFTLRQTIPDEADPPPPDYRGNPMKHWWFSDPVVIMEPDFDPHPMWFRLECIGYGQFELSLLVYPSGAVSAAQTVPNNVIQFKVQDGVLGSLNTAVECNPIVLTFSDIEKKYLQIGSGGPFTCNPFDALEYSAVVTE